MLAETVSAVGNAYGYEHTVTVGIISQLSRTVQVNDEQIYRNLIQTDAAINPGNSGGPLLNTYGEMIGINVAVRIGAQGIAFAIPVNDAMDVAARLMAKLTKGDLLHGLVAETVFENNLPQLKVKQVLPATPAAKAGLKRGDQITSINSKASTHAVHFQSALIGKSSREPVKFSIKRDGRKMELAMKLKSNQAKVSTVAWSELGVKVSNVSASEMSGMHDNYVRGLRVTEVRQSSPADEEGILEGDIIVAMHGWKTETVENLAFVLGEDIVKNEKEFMFYILRDREPFWGQMRVAARNVVRH
jgi:serine protease Do